VQHPEQLNDVMNYALSVRDSVENARQATRFFYIFDQYFCIEKSEQGLVQLIRGSVSLQSFSKEPCLPEETEQGHSCQTV
jgi:hypothetical protein